MTFKFQIFLFLLLLMNSSAHCAAAEGEESKGQRFRTSLHDGRFAVEGTDKIGITSEELGTVLQAFSTSGSRTLEFFGVEFEDHEMTALQTFLQGSSLVNLSFYGSSISGDSARILLSAVAETPSLKTLSISNKTYGDSFLFHLGTLQSRETPLRLLLKDTSFLTPKDNLRNLLFNKGIDALWLVRAALDYQALTTVLGSGQGPLKSLWICQGDDEAPLPPSFHVAVKSYGIEDVLPSGKQRSRRPLPRRFSTEKSALPHSQRAVVSGNPLLNPPSDVRRSLRLRKSPSTGNILALRAPKSDSQGE